MTSKAYQGTIQEGQRFGRLTTISKEIVKKGNSNLSAWNCSCDCGNQVQVLLEPLRTGKKKSCGCLQAEHSTSPVSVGMQFGKLTVVEKIKEPKKSPKWLCQCDCGGQRGPVQTDELTSGRAKDCGCVRQEALINELIGKRFGRLMIESFAGRMGSGDDIHYNVVCDCGTKKIVRRNQLISNKTKSCGCLYKDSQKIAERSKIAETGASQKKIKIGDRFGKLVVVSHDRYDRPEHYWLCDCDCGNQSVVSTHAIYNGFTKSCGCIKKTQDGLSDHILYNTWVGMIDRCENEKSRSYANYGKRGISVCGRWKTLSNFIDDMHPSFVEGLTLDRIDVNGNYEPENCRWADAETQGNNRRNNIVVEHNGETLTVSQWARRLKMPAGTLYGRIKAGWSVDDAFYKPTTINGKHNNGKISNKTTSYFFDY